MPTHARKVNREGGSSLLDDDDEDEALSVGSKRRLIDGHHDDDVEHSAQLHTPKEAAVKVKLPKPKLSASRTTATSKGTTTSMRLRGQAADALEWVQNSEDVLYATKLTVALFLVLWPAFVASWNAWFSFNRGCKSALRIPFPLFARF